MIINIAVIGAFDRFNYGDLLMPIIFEQQIIAKKTHNFKLFYYGYKKTDMSNFGAYKTKLIENIKNDNIDVAIFIGGDMLPIIYTKTYMDLKENKINIFILKFVKKIIGKTKFEKICKSKLNGETNHPWIYTKKGLNVDKIIYNTVGGTLSVNDSVIFDAIKNSDYFSVRNIKDKQNLTFEGVKLYPDSVMSISKFYNDGNLKNLMTKKNIDLHNKINQNYFIFQVNNYIGKKYFEKIIFDIEQMYNKYQLVCLLQPIGYANNHNDDEILKKILKKVKTPVFMCNKGNVFDIIYNISKAKFYVGTSLHGIITSASYCVPHISYTNEIDKELNFIETWKTTPIKYTLAGNLCEKYEQLFKVDNLNSIMKKNRDVLLNLTQENFENIYNIILGKENSEKNG